MQVPAQRVGKTERLEGCINQFEAMITHRLGSGNAMRCAPVQPNLRQTGVNRSQPRATCAWAQLFPALQGFGDILGSPDHVGITGILADDRVAGLVCPHVGGLPPDELLSLIHI